MTAWLVEKMLLVSLAAVSLAAAGPAHAAKPHEAAQAAPAPATTVPEEPQQTTATFGDWVVRCERPASAAPNQPILGEVCEAAQALLIKGQQAPVAQIAFSRSLADGRESVREASKEAGKAADKGASDAGLTLTVLLPVNISFDKPPRLVGSDDKDGATLTLRRCVPGGCLADARPGTELTKELRAASAKPAHLIFTDAAERTLTLPLSTRGLAQALDDLAREAIRDGDKELKDGGRDKG